MGCFPGARLGTWTDEWAGMRDLLIRILLFCFVLSLGASAEQDTLSYLLRIDGYSTEAATLEKLVDLKMSPQWSAIMRNPKSVRERKALARLLNRFAGTGDAGRVSDVRRLHTGMMLATLEEWRGDFQLRLRLNFAPDARSRRETVRGLERLANSVEEVVKGVDSFRLTAEFSPYAETVERSALDDGGPSVMLTVPARSSWSQARVSQILRTR